MNEIFIPCRIIKLISIFWARIKLQVSELIVNSSKLRRMHIKNNFNKKPEVTYNMYVWNFFEITITKKSV